ncbi:MAG: hypothetical protein ACI9HK_006101, partial [Pirellulaceae bacterium]
MTMLLTLRGMSASLVLGMVIQADHATRCPCRLVGCAIVAR